jgi:hypothetical protein
LRRVNDNGRINDVVSDEIKSSADFRVPANAAPEAGRRSQGIVSKQTSLNKPQDWWRDSTDAKISINQSV